MSYVDPIAGVNKMQSQQLEEITLKSFFAAHALQGFLAASKPNSNGNISIDADSLVAAVEDIAEKMRLKFRGGK